MLWTALGKNQQPLRVVPTFWIQQILNSPLGTFILKYPFLIEVAKQKEYFPNKAWCCIRQTEQSKT